MKTEFTVVKSTESSNGGFVNTLEISKSSVFGGVAKTTKRRFLIKTDAELVEGLIGDLDFADYTQTPRTFLNEKGEERTSVWLEERVG